MSDLFMGSDSVNTLQLQRLRMHRGNGIACAVRAEEF
jgi:hypothetical protein